LRRPAPALAMICLSEVGQLKVDGEGLGHVMRLSNVQTADNPLRPIHQLMPRDEIFAGRSSPRLQFTVFDEQQSQLFNRGEKFVSDLLFQYFTPERHFLQVGGLAYQLSQPGFLIVYFPEWFSSRHDFIPQQPTSIT
jgi:hypothetical protein